MFQNTSDNALKNSKKTVHIETLGCRLNQIESESAASFFYNNGFSVVMKSVTARDRENPDVVLAIVNTCTVTAKAEQKARRIIRLLLKKFPNAVLIVTGCYAQVNRLEISKISSRIAVLPGRLKSRLSEVPEKINLILQENEKSPESVPEKIIECLNGKICSGIVPEVSENPFKLSTDTFLAHSRSSIKVQDGCNSRCTYCEICIARGKSVSLDVQEVLDRVEKIRQTGQKEVVITTVNASQYCGKYKDCNSENNAETNVDFAGLLEILLKKTQGISFRISSLYPQIVDDRFCRIIQDERIRPHFHLSVQSGSDDVLLKMARPYKAQAVLDACRRLKLAKKNPFLACDIIAGFPSETDEDFEKTMALVNECGFAWIHAFPFSPRPDTRAFLMKPKVPEAVTDRRIASLLDFAFDRKIKYINSLCNTECRAIVETTRSLSFEKILGTQKYVSAVTENFLHCVVKLDESQTVPPPSSEITVRILSALPESIKSNAEIEAVAELVSL
ncbi:MAG: tRNA (N(6)-L-threonylcarbamoyladenosine(37)-C(2))-methylthiotransferase MtaB [Treponema sp.]